VPERLIFHVKEKKLMEYLVRDRESLMKIMFAEKLTLSLICLRHIFALDEIHLSKLYEQKEFS